MSVAALSIGAALAAGLAGAAHCTAMCGGIATVVGAGFRADRRGALASALAFNGGRLLGYASVGAGLAAALGTSAASASLAGAALAGRLLAAVVLAALAVRLLSGRDFLRMERFGRAAWERLRPAFGAASRLPPALRPAALGLLWGFMPCGLVYSVLLVAATSGDASNAALTMLAFGTGTLPALLGLTVAGSQVGLWLRRPALRRTAGTAVLAAALWTFAAALLHPPGAHVHGHDRGGPAADTHAHAPNVRA
jgi:sulfite exporter TauE/SafE